MVCEVWCFFFLVCFFSVEYLWNSQKFLKMCQIQTGLYIMISERLFFEKTFSKFQGFFWNSSNETTLRKATLLLLYFLLPNTITDLWKMFIYHVAPTGLYYVL